MKKISFIVLFFVSAIAFSQKPIFTSAKVKSATVYFNAAELLQTTSLNLPLGNSEIVIKNVANSLNESTIQIGAPSSLTVLSVQFTDNYISEFEIDENSPVIKKVRDSIILVQKDISKLQTSIVSHSKTIELLDKNQQVFGLNSGLNVLELMKMVDYYNNKRTELNNAIALLQEKANKFNEKLSKLNEKLAFSEKNDEKSSSGKLILQVMNSVAGNVPLDISYVTNTATWSPFYDLRAESIAAPINMMYKAQVIQSSGIDWKKVKLTLSSGMPNANNQAPLLQSWFLRYQNQNGYLKEVEYLKKDSRQNVIQSLNGRAAGIAINSSTSSISNYTTINENQLNVSFDIDIQYDILSNGKIHSVALKEIKLPATYKYYAVPRVEKEAFLLAEISDYSKFNLLQGDANIIFEGMYVGKTNINPNQTSDTLNLSMGRDKRISIKRERVVEKSSTKFLSSFKEQTFTFDIILRNNKKEGVDLLLKDQYPLSSDKEITIELLQSDNAKINLETGILTWQLKLLSAETKKIRLSYKVRYPKDKVLGNL